MPVTQVFLQLDSQIKATVENLFVVSAQVPALGLGGTLNEDGAAVFRIAKEFCLSQPVDETKVVEIEDVLRFLRFTCWMLSNEPNAELKQLLASVVMQMQAQHYGFENLLKSFGIDRQLENQLPRKSGRETSLNLQHTKRVNQTRIRVSREGADMQTTTVESTWSASGRKKP